ncbi:MAG: sensor histidine kinase [Gammaproteobacteria bacterium]|nr:sensor histidine kinase [Gammaproteobacteria bacterium]
MEHMIPLLQHMLVFLGLAYLFTKTPVFTALVNNSLSLPDKAIIYLVFSGFCILGTTFSEPSVQTDDAIANTRAIGAVLGGLLGGPIVGFLVGITGGIHRVFSMSSISDPINYIDIACAVATTFEGLVAGCVHHYLSRKGKIETLFSPRIVWLVAFVVGLGHVAIILLFGLYTGNGIEAWNLEKEIGLPMLIANSVGAALIMYMIKEQKKACDELSSSAAAWKIADKTASIIYGRFNQESSRKIAEIIQHETRVGAVAITDRNRLLAFAGLGEDHHRPGAPISSEDTLEVIRENKVLFTDGIRKTYQCRLKKSCKLGSSLIIPLRDDANNEVVGTIKLYEPKNKLFRNINRKLGENLAHLLSGRILAGHYELQRELRIQDQHKILMAQINPHFLYNALTTIGHITGKQPERARKLLHYLSDFFRKNLKMSDDTTTLGDEREHVESYLEIEKARFEDRLQIQINIPEHLLTQVIPVFTLQPIVENSIKHGTSELLGIGIIKIMCVENNDSFILTVEDNAGLYKKSNANGIGLKIDERIKICYGNDYGISIQCEPEQWTKVNIHLPKNKEQA